MNAEEGTFMKKISRRRFLYCGGATLISTAITQGIFWPFYDRVCEAQRIHFEIATLVVPGYVDDTDMLKQMCGWILHNLGPDYPLHFLRFFPRYKLDRLPPTPISTLTRFREIAMAEGIHYVYVGNVPEHEGNHTYCHHCKNILIERQGYIIPTYNLEGNQCKFCKTSIPGVWHDLKVNPV
jgi:pyruvate formate lyase activating enzyme